jgi:hypothetical protein
MEHAVPERFSLFLDFVVAVAGPALSHFGVAQPPRGIHFQAGKRLADVLPGVVIGAFFCVHGQTLAV